MSFVLTLSALIYTFALTHWTNGQAIDVANPSLKNTSPYPEDSWTPQTWFSAVLSLPFVNEDQKNNVKKHWRLMEGWKWNLVTLFLIEFAVVTFAILEYLTYRRTSPRAQTSETTKGREEGI
jgi:hypothetical protein